MVMEFIFSKGTKPILLSWKAPQQHTGLPSAQEKMVSIRWLILDSSTS